MPRRPVAPGRLVDDDVFDDGVRPGWDPVGDKRGHADDHIVAAKQGRTTKKMLDGEATISSRSARPSAAAVEDSCREQLCHDLDEFVGHL